MRGQTLLLLALSMLFVALMALISIEVGFRTRERVEAQMVSDAAAYTQALSTARALNMVALMNRAKVAGWVSALGAQSLISWSTQQRAAREALATAYEACPATAALGATLRARFADPEFVRRWDELDGLAAEQVAAAAGNRNLSGLIMSLYNDELLGQRIAGQALTRELIARAGASLSAPDAGAAKSLDELRMADPEDDLPDGVVRNSGYPHAALGARGWSFVTARRFEPDQVMRGLEAVTDGGTVPALVVESRFPTGGSGFGPDPWFAGKETIDGVTVLLTQEASLDAALDAAKRAQENPANSRRALWAIDYGGTFDFEVEGCRQSVPVALAYVMSSNGATLTSRHYGGDVDESPSVRHGIGNCMPDGRGCPSILGGHLLFNDARMNDPAEDFGQPTLYTITARDERPMPWRLAFRLGSYGGFDSRLLARSTGVSQAVTLSSALVYYHRPQLPSGGGFIEPPNLINPFWRATLTRANDDAAARLRAAGFERQAIALDRLVASGFKGVQ